MLHRQVVVTEALVHISADEKENDRFVEGKQLLCGGRGRGEVFVVR